MPLTNFPGGVASFGMPLPSMGLYDAPPANIWFVCNRAGVINGDGTSRDKPAASIADAVVKISTTNPTQGDWIIVLSGHAENVTGSNIFSGSLVNTGSVTIPRGTRIIGEGFGSSRPVLTFTAAGATIALANADCTVENIVLQAPQSGTTSVTVGVSVTAANCMVRQCDWQMGGSTNALIATGIQLSSAATGFKALDNFGYGLGTGTPTAWLATTGTVGPGQVQVLRNNVILTLSSATGGVVDVSSASGTAPANWIMGDNNLGNLATNSTVAVKGVAGWTGFLPYNGYGITNATGGASAVSTPGSTWAIQHFGTVQGKTGISVGTASG